MPAIIGFILLIRSIFVLQVDASTKPLTFHCSILAVFMLFFKLLLSLFCSYWGDDILLLLFEQSRLLLSRGMCSGRLQSCSTISIRSYFFLFGGCLRGISGMSIFSFCELVCALSSDDPPNLKRFDWY